MSALAASTCPVSTMSTHTVAANVAYRGKPATLIRAAPMIPLLLSTTDTRHSWSRIGELDVNDDCTLGVVALETSINPNWVAAAGDVAAERLLEPPQVAG